MSDWVLYHNPRCAKSRAAIRCLEAHEISPRIVLYLKEPLTLAELLALMDHLEGPIAALVRQPSVLREKGIEVEDRHAVAAFLAAEPAQLQRPIVLRGDRAMIARDTGPLEDWIGQVPA